MGVGALQFAGYNSGEAPSARTRAREITGIDRAKKLILERYAESLLLDDIVAESGLSRFRFLRLFKQKVGYSPHEFLIHCRIEKAKQFLAHQVSVLQAAMDTGFFDQSHFCRHFKRITGVSPGAYRRSMRNDCQA